MLQLTGIAFQKDHKAPGERWTGPHVGQPSSCEITFFGVPTLSIHAEGNTASGAVGKPRRSQRSRMSWQRFACLADFSIPRPKILHPYPNVRLLRCGPNILRQAR